MTGMAACRVIVVLPADGSATMGALRFIDLSINVISVHIGKLDLTIDARFL
ncbi:MAG: hypothetical protein AAFQ40_07480 [Cyanobacteria bacterium J06623_5]